MMVKAFNVIYVKLFPPGHKDPICTFQQWKGKALCDVKQVSAQCKQ